MATQTKKKVDRYSDFNKVDGDHPIKKIAPNSYIDYQARTRHGGSVDYFNFDVAKDIGLIPSDHSGEMDDILKEKILETFGILIINEYDIENEIKFPKEDIKQGTYMATRYLQLQHPDKTGRTSGDGRSVWNGFIKNRGKTFDISSCGTGATVLSPATAIHKKHFESGDPSISYGCGYGEYDEALASAFMSEIFYQNGIKTERVLAIINYGKNIAICVRAYDNLLRPSHLFCHLKQENYFELSKLTKYHIERQEKNGTWKDVPKTYKPRLDYFLKRVCSDFAKAVATFEMEYIFCWLDWDGDNVLMDGGIIDYGSIRQFGLLYSEYRFDDDDRFSTTILEQKNKSRYMLQNFAQMIDYLKNNEKKPINDFKNDPILKEYDDIYNKHKCFLLAKKVGFAEKHAHFLMDKHFELLEDFYYSYNYFEKIKSVSGMQKVTDGINCNMVFNVRNILRELPQLFLSGSEEISVEEFVDIGKSSYALEEDLESNPYRIKKIKNFLDQYKELAELVAKEYSMSYSKMLLEISMRSSVINKYDRITGDGATYIIDYIAKHNKELSPEELYTIFQEIKEGQNFVPAKKTHHKPIKSAKLKKHIHEIQKLIRECSEGI